MANALFVSNAAILSMLNNLAASIDAGTAAVINLYSGSVPSDADAALSGNTLLAQMVMNATAFGSATDIGGSGRITAAAITSDSSADNTGTATFFRVLTQNAGTVVLQGTAGTSAADLLMNTVAVTSGSTVSVSSFILTLAEG